MIMYYQTKFGGKRISSSENTEETVMLWPWPWKYHNTEVGNNIIGGLEDIICINIKISILCCDFDLECRNPIHSNPISS